MATERQIAANRLNSQKSTGPRTPEGKRRSSMNALKHGLCAETMVVPGEDAAELEEFHDRVRGICRPRDAVEESIVHQFVMADWRGRRFSRIESGAVWGAYNESVTHYEIHGFRREVAKPETPEERATFMLGGTGRTLAGRSGVLASFSRYEGSIRRTYFQSLQMVLSMRARETEAREGGGRVQAPVSTRFA